FFQAEDGIRDLIVTGVQTCALPISNKIEPRSGNVSNNGSENRAAPGRTSRWSSGNAPESLSTSTSRRAKGAAATNSRGAFQFSHKAARHSGKSLPADSRATAKVS